MNGFSFNGSGCGGSGPIRGHMEANKTFNIGSSSNFDVGVARSGNLFTSGGVNTGSIGAGHSFGNTHVSGGFSKSSSDNLFRSGGVHSGSIGVGHNFGGNTYASAGVSKSSSNGLFGSGGVTTTSVGVNHHIGGNAYIGAGASKSSNGNSYAGVNFTSKW